MPAPTRWAESPRLFSYSLLSKVERCPLSWQLANSEWGALGRFPLRRVPQAVEGEIVHAALDVLWKALARAGLPPIGSSVFRTVIADLALESFVEDERRQQVELLERHPRPFDLGRVASTQLLFNRVIRLFRSDYGRMHEDTTPRSKEPAPRQGAPGPASRTDANLAAALAHHGALAEVTIRDEDLMFQGVLDLVTQSGDGFEIVDYKTGAPNANHREQVLYYAVLWMRRTQSVPARVSLRYPNESWSQETSRDELRAVESRLRTRVAAAHTTLSEAGAAKAVLSEQCRWCDVRAWCDTYWKANSNAGSASESSVMDLELVIEHIVGSNGFEGRSADGRGIKVVFERQVPSWSQVVHPGSAVRVLRILQLSSGAFSLTASSEIFVVSAAETMSGRLPSK